jgi:hypothetical protein
MGDPYLVEPSKMANSHLKEQWSYRSNSSSLLRQQWGETIRRSGRFRTGLMVPRMLSAEVAVNPRAD